MCMVGRSREGGLNLVAAGMANKQGNAAAEKHFTDNANRIDGITANGDMSSGGSSSLAKSRTASRPSSGALSSGRGTILAGGMGAKTMLGQ